MKCAALWLITMGLFCGCAPCQRKDQDNTPPSFSALPSFPSEQSPPQPRMASGDGQPPFIYVHGEFKSPGRYDWTNGMTLKDAIAAAGGFTEFAWPRIVIQHPDSSKQQYKWSSARPLRNNPALKPGDKVWNPRR